MKKSIIIYVLKILFDIIGVLKKKKNVNSDFWNILYLVVHAMIKSKIENYVIH